MKSVTAKNFSLQRTLECGQCFNWRKTRDNEYYSTIGNKLVTVKQKDRKIFFDGCTAAEIRNYFSLDHALPRILRETNTDARMKRALEFGSGITVLRQEPWECAVSFIVSQNSNIPRITSTLQKIRAQYGTKVSRNGTTYHAFPTPQQLSRASEAQLKKFGLGYRARFVHKFAAHVARHHDDFLALKKLPYAAARNELMKHLGVGRKVADCICLYSLGKLEAFPVDRWIERKMLEFYCAEIRAFAGKKKGKINEKEIGDFARAKFGKFAGYAQQYLFYWARENA